MFKQEIKAFTSRLSEINISEVSDVHYCKKYLQHLMLNRNYYLLIYSKVLEQVIFNSDLKKESITLIDYGAGNGLLGLFAKFCGFGKIIINDIDKSFIKSAQTLAIGLNISVDQFITGDINTIQKECFFIKPDAIVGTDIIEHIYNLNSFFTIMKEINSNMVSVFTTGSNPENYFKIKKLRALQFKDEHTGGIADDFGFADSQSHPSYFQIRKDIISAINPEFDEMLIIKMAKLTRGLNREDIKQVVLQYEKTGQFPNEPEPFNTCNPLTGSWTERILSIKEYHIIYKNSNFSAQVSPGFYNIYYKGVKKLIMVFINNLVSIFGLKFAPFIFIVGKRCE